MIFSHFSFVSASFSWEHLLLTRLLVRHYETWDRMMEMKRNEHREKRRQDNLLEHKIRLWKWLNEWMNGQKKNRNLQLKIKQMKKRNIFKFLQMFTIQFFFRKERNSLRSEYALQWKWIRKKKFDFVSCYCQLM